MKTISVNYGKVLYLLHVQPETVEACQELLALTPFLPRVLSSPAVEEGEKEKVIRRIFPQEMQGFFSVLCRNGHMALLPEIWEAYHRVYCEKEGILEARLLYVHPPKENQVEQIRKYLQKKHHRQDVRLEMVQDASLIGGFRLEALATEADWSIKGRLKQLQERLTRR